MNFWQEKPQFWENKTLDNQIYERQAEEVRNDLLTFGGGRTFADIGGYKGRIGVGKVYDIVDGFDLAQDWEKQGFTPVSVCFTSLVLICFDRPTVMHILEEMINGSQKGIYLFEEAWNPKFDAGGQVNGNYGGKWSHDWELYLREIGIKYTLKQSEVNPAWVRLWGHR